VPVEKNQVELLEESSPYPREEDFEVRTITLESKPAKVRK